MRPDVEVTISVYVPGTVLAKLQILDSLLIGNNMFRFLKLLFREGNHITAPFQQASGSNSPSSAEELSCHLHDHLQVEHTFRYQRNPRSLSIRQHLRLNHDGVCVSLVVRSYALEEEKATRLEGHPARPNLGSLMHALAMYKITAGQEGADTSVNACESSAFYQSI